jgi:DNA-binding NtrC family response regulator
MPKKRILLADDDRDFLETRKEFFERAGFDVQTALGPKEAQHLLEQGAIDLAVLDMRLRNDEDERDFSGLEVAEQVAPALPKIILTRFASVEAVRRALGPRLNGLPPAIDFVPKQDGPQALLTAVRRALDQWERQGDHIPATSPSAPEQPEDSVAGMAANRVSLYNNLVIYFNLEEIRTLCFLLEIDFDNLPGDGKAAKARELVLYCRRHRTLGKLRDAIRRERNRM